MDYEPRSMDPHNSEETLSLIDPDTISEISPEDELAIQEMEQLLHSPSPQSKPTEVPTQMTKITTPQQQNPNKVLHHIHTVDQQTINIIVPQLPPNVQVQNNPRGKHGSKLKTIERANIKFPETWPDRPFLNNMLTVKDQGFYENGTFSPVLSQTDCNVTGVAHQFNKFAVTFYRDLKPKSHRLQQKRRFLDSSQPDHIFVLRRDPDFKYKDCRAKDNLLPQLESLHKTQLGDIIQIDTMVTEDPNQLKDELPRTHLAHVRWATNTTLLQLMTIMFGPNPSLDLPCRTSLLADILLQIHHAEDSLSTQNIQPFNIPAKQSYFSIPGTIPTILTLSFSNFSLSFNPPIGSYFILQYFAPNTPKVREYTAYLLTSRRTSQFDLTLTFELTINSSISLWKTSPNKRPNLQGHWTLLQTSASTFPKLLFHSFQALCPRLSDAQNTDTNLAHIALGWSGRPSYRFSNGKKSSSAATTSHSTMAEQDPLTLVTDSFIHGDNKLTLIEGYPGCGKTHLVIQTLTTLLNKPNTGKILVTCHSNHAANEILSRLNACGFPNNTILRLFAPDKKFKPYFRKNYAYTLDAYIRAPSTNPEIQTLQQELANLEELLHSIPPTADFKKIMEDAATWHNKISSIKEALEQEILGTINFRLIICTNAMTQSESLKPFRFKYACIDEASQSSLLEIMACIHKLTEDGQLLLSGDPKQLPPFTTLSGMAQNLLQTSSIHILTENTVPIIRLSRSFRSTPDIINFPSCQFYSGQLHSQLPSNLSEPFLAHACTLFPILTKAPPGNSILWVETATYEIIQEDSKSKANLGELAALNTLLPHFSQMPNTISILTYYAKQRNLIQSQFYDLNIPILTLDEAQGSESDIVFLSMVRSIPSGPVTTLGIVDCPFRQCVALTRAKRFLVILGNPRTLSHNKRWRTLYENCVQNNMILTL